MEAALIVHQTDTARPLQRSQPQPGATPRFSGLERQRRRRADHTPPPTPRGVAPGELFLPGWTGS